MGIFARAAMEIRGYRLQQFSPQSTAYWVAKLFGGGFATASGVNVTAETAMTEATVFAACRNLAEDLAALPLPVYRGNPQGNRRADIDYTTPAYRILNEMANPEMTAFSFKETIHGHVALRGDGYAEKEFDQGLRVKALWPLNPGKMRMARNGQNGFVVDGAPAGRLFFIYLLPNGQEKVFDSDLIFHPRGFGPDGLRGYSIVALMREAIGLSLATDEYIARFYGNDASPGAVLTHPKTLSEPARDRIQTDWKKAHEGLENSHRLAILEEGLSVSKVGVDPVDSQTLECVVPETRLTMADGSLRRADAVQVGDALLGWDHETGRLIPSRVTDVGDNGVHPLVRITTDRGRSLTTTENHPYLASPRQRCEKCGRRHQAKAGWPQRWIRADELAVGDYVRVGLEVDPPGSMDAHTGWFLGALIGDGHLRSTGSVGFTNVDAGVLDRMREVSSRLVGADMVASSGPDYYFRANGYGRNNRLRAFLADHGVADRTAHTKNVPETVLAGGRAAWAGFISGLIDTDGTVGQLSRPQPAARIDTVSLDLAEGVQHVLAMLGVQSSLGQTRSTYLGRPWLIWNVRITGRDPVRRLAGIVDLAHGEKRSRLDAWSTRTGRDYHPDFFALDRIKSVDRLPAGPTVMLEVEGTHSHVTNGLITHNTRRFQRDLLGMVLRMPPDKLGNYERATYANLEQSDINYVRYGLTPRGTRFEQQLRADGVVDADHHAVHDYIGLMKGDSVARAAYLHSLRQDGAISGEDIRTVENFAPSGQLAASELLVPLNMMPASAFQANGMTLAQAAHAALEMARGGWVPEDINKFLGLGDLRHTGLMPGTNTPAPGEALGEATPSGDGSSGSNSLRFLDDEVGRGLLAILGAQRNGHEPAPTIPTPARP